MIAYGRYGRRWHASRMGRRNKLAQGMRTETVKLHGVRDGRGLDICKAICSVTFCPCNMPAIAKRRQRVIQIQCTSFFKWVCWRPEWEHIGTPHRIKAAESMATKRLKRHLFGKSYPQ